MILSHDPHVDLQIADAAVAQLPAYLAGRSLTRPIYVNVGGAAYRPAISLGFVLDLLHELQLRAPALSADETALLARLHDDLRVARTLHRADYARHLTQELTSLLDTWEAYLDDLAGGEDAGAANHATEARKRTRIALLLAEAAAHDIDVAAHAERTAHADRRMDDILVPGAYVGPAGLANAFPADRFRWLHRSPKPSRSH